MEVYSHRVHRSGWAIRFSRKGDRFRHDGRRSGSMCLLHTAWIYWNQKRAEQDRVEMYHYKDEAEAMLKGKSQYPKSAALPFYKQSACLFQIGTAYLIGTFSILVRHHWLIG
jgi:cbb3-type cytochrome oxidase subunit 3